MWIFSPTAEVSRFLVLRGVPKNDGRTMMTISKDDEGSPQEPSDREAGATQTQQAGLSDGLATRDPSSGGDHWTTSLKHQLDFYETFRSYARHEDNLINNRLTWILTIHGFLYATYGFTIQKKLEIIEKISAGSPAFVHFARCYSTSNHSDALLWSLLQVEVFMLLICIVGSCISAFGFWSISAAKNSAIAVSAIYENQFSPADTEINFENAKDGKDRVVKLRTVQLKGDGEGPFLPAILGGGEKYTNDVGSSASRTIPLVLLGSWFFAALSSFAFAWPQLLALFRASCAAPEDDWVKALEMFGG
ncbi:hypothetical protein P0R31_36995 [Bradyrhizobium yuanmingense]|uniref:hypothetical protein n=1 Tax=Bradyrhizobium yuanmingense TaxID=108015 RepID=UPI0023B96AA9|nr:hypothetical protein [Bradyrhizobium yuanmingense]MDF0522836.1 hypothetical protein [Bradyrhizobium yuanmingense]